jgi:hypothetical protein
MNQDPTAQEMRDYLRQQFGSECDPVDDMTLSFPVECAIYWFANDWHSGQSSNLYSALSTSEYKPGMAENGPELDSVDAMMYEALETQFTAWGKDASATWGDGYDSASR